MRESPLRLALLDYLAYRIGCEYLSGLHELDSVRRARLRRAVTQLKAEDAPLDEWNDALAYLAGRPPASDAAAAREELLSFLSAAG